MLRKDNLIFIHPLKCGGSAFRQAVIQHYKIGDGDYSKTFNITGKNRVEEFSKIGDKSKICFFYGHAHNEITIDKAKLLSKETKKKFHLVITIREPIDRIISTYYYIRLDKCRNNPVYNILHKYTLEEIYKDGFIDSLENKERAVAIHNYFFNYQTRIFSGHKIPIEYFTDKPEIVNIENNDITRAKENILNKFSYIGYQPTIDKDWNFFCHRFGIKYPCEYFFKHENRPSVTEGRPKLEDIDRKTIELIEANNQRDIELFDWIMKEGRNTVNHKEL